MSERVNPPELGPPRGFSHAVVASPGRIVGDGVVAQFERALDNLLTALRAAGGEPQHLATLTVYAVDLADYREHAREIGAVWRRLVGTDYPAMAGIGVARLWDDEALVEVQGIAALPS